MNDAINTLLEQLPATYTPFDDTEYPMPVASAILAALPDVAQLKEWLTEADKGQLKSMMEPVAVAAEVIEACAPDRSDFFMSDNTVRSNVFAGAKWRAGMVLLAGDRVGNSLAEELHEKEYILFSADSAVKHRRALPPRETGAIHFLQMMVRYAMIWGMIPPGQDHEMGHFLEQDFPGAMIVRGAVGPVEGLVLLAVMKMGCPAIVDSSFPYDIGPRVVADTDAEILQALAELPNMRVRHLREQSTLPSDADPALARESFEAARRLTGVFQLRPGKSNVAQSVEGDATASEIAVIVEIDDPKLDLPISAYLQSKAVEYGSFLRGVKTGIDDDRYTVDIAADAAFSGELLADVIRAALLHDFPRLGPIHVGVRFGKSAVDREAARAAGFESRRAAAILDEHEETVEEFAVCIDCQPFSHNHVCIVTPDRPPMCGRPRDEIKACALWGANYRPWTRRNLANDDLQYVVAKGKPVDEAAGEWVGVNEAAHRLTGGKLDRVRIHSVLDAPHTSCGCFAALAFRIPDTDWIGVMERNYAGVAPGNLTWVVLANRAGGKQAPGVCGITFTYLASRKAFAGDGGLGSVKWVTRKAMQAMAAHLPPRAKIAVEDEATTLVELRNLLESADGSPSV